MMDLEADKQLLINTLHLYGGRQLQVYFVYTSFFRLHTEGVHVLTCNVFIHAPGYDNSGSVNWERSNLLAGIVHTKITRQIWGIW